MIKSAITFGSLFLELALGAGDYTLKVPTEPLTLKKELYQDKNSVVFLVNDAVGNKYNLKVLALQGETAPTDTLKQVPEMKHFKEEQNLLIKMGAKACSGLLEAKPGEMISCKDNHVLFSVKSDVKKLLFSSGETVALKKDTPMNDLKDIIVDIKPKRLLFAANILQQHLEGGRLIDIIMASKNSPSSYAEKIVSGYRLFKIISPQLIEAIKFLHEDEHIVHLNISPKSIMCSDLMCDNAQLTELGDSWNGKLSSDRSIPLIAEGLQNSIRFSQETPKKTKDLLSLTKPALTFKNAASIDWFSFGATLYNTITGDRPLIEADGTRKNSLKELGSILLSKDTGSNDQQLIAQRAIEALKMVDGLMETKRADRITFDSLNLKQDLVNLRRRNKQSLLETDDISSFVGVSCSSYVNFSASNDFMRRVCIN